MFNAEEIREIALKSAVRIKKLKDPSDILFKHFEEKIKEYSEKGAFEIKNIVFPIERFTEKEYSKAIKQLKDLDFKTEVEVNNAYQKVKFSIFW